MRQQANATNMEHTQMLGPQNNVADLQQSHRFLAHHNNLSNLRRDMHRVPYFNNQVILINKSGHINHKDPFQKHRQVSKFRYTQSIEIMAPEVVIFFGSYLLHWII